MILLINNLVKKDRPIAKESGRLCWYTVTMILSSIYCSFLGKVSCRCMVVLSTFLDDSATIKNSYRELKTSLQKLETLNSEVEKELKKDLQKQTEHIIAALKSHMKAEEVQER